MADQISWQVELAVKPNQLANLRALTQEMVEFTRSEAGVLLYERFISADAATVYVYERYIDSAAAVTHLQAFQQHFGERFAQLVERKRFTVFGAPNAELRAILDRFGATYCAFWAGFTRA